MKKETAVRLLTEMAELGTLGLDEIRSIQSELDSARRRHFTNKRSPEDRKAAAEKAKQTRLRDAAETARWMAEAPARRSEQIRKETTERTARRAVGLLPFEISTYSTNESPATTGRPARELYEQNRYESDRYHLYKDHYDTIVDKQTAEWYWDLSPRTH